MTRNYRVRFCQNNMLAASGVVLAASGAMSGYPVSNLIDPFRYRPWIPPGTFEVTTANQKLYINDGADKTATITAGTYTYSTLTTAVATALNAASSGWTCTYDFSGETFKFTIARSGTKTLRLSQTTNAAWDMLGYVGAVDQDASVADEIRCHTSEWFTVDFGVARSPKALFLIAAADALFPVSSQATTTLKADNIDDFTAPAISRAVTREDLGIFHWLDDLDDTAYRYWKFEFSDRKNPSGPESFALNIGYLGDYVTPVSSNIINGFERQIEDNSSVVKSISGVPYFRLKPQYWTYANMAVEYLSGSERAEIEALGSQLGVTTPFFLALDPTVVLSQTAGEMTKYVRFTQPLHATHVIRDMHNISFAAEELI